jgi:hypothetical protein
MNCKLCENKIEGHGNNGEPLVKGQVCKGCNWKVIKERIKQWGKNKTYEVSHLDLMNVLFKMRERGEITEAQYNESEKRFKELEK